MRLNELHELYDYDTLKSVRSMFNFLWWQAGCGDIYLLSSRWLFQPFLSWKKQGDPAGKARSCRNTSSLVRRCPSLWDILEFNLPSLFHVANGTVKMKIATSWILLTDSFHPRLTCLPLISRLKNWTKKIATRIIYSCGCPFSRHDTHSKLWQLHGGRG